MDLSMVVEIISTLGFPVALTIACVWFFYKIYTWQREDAKERENKDREVIEKFSHIIATNSEALLENAKVMVNVYNENSTAMMVCTTSAPTTTKTCAVYLWKPVSQTGVKTYIEYIAIGKWK